MVFPNVMFFRVRRLKLDVAITKLRSVVRGILPYFSHGIVFFHKLWNCVSFRIFWFPLSHFAVGFHFPCCCLDIICFSSKFPSDWHSSILSTDSKPFRSFIQINPFWRDVKLCSSSLVVFVYFISTFEYRTRLVWSLFSSFDDLFLISVLTLLLTFFCTPLACSFLTFFSIFPHGSTTFLQIFILTLVN